MAAPRSRRQKPLEDRVTLPRSAWPPQDQAAWDRLLKPTLRRPAPTGTNYESGYDTRGRLSRRRTAAWKRPQRTPRNLDSVSPATRKHYEVNYGVWVAFERRRYGLQTAAPEDRITPDRVAEFIEVELKRLPSPVSVHTTVKDIFLLARRWAPQRDWRWLGEIERELRRSMRPSRDKAKQMDFASNVLHLGLRLMEEAEMGTDRPARERAIKYRDGLMIAIMARRPYRRSNFERMEIGVHLQKVGDIYHLAFTAREMKARKAHELPLQPELTRYVDRYLAEYRPVLCSCSRRRYDGKRVWVGEWAEPIKGPAIHAMATSRTRERLGKAIPPHRLRDITATTGALAGSKYMDSVKALLAHSNWRMAEQHYVQAGQIGAAVSFSDHVTALLEATAEAADGAYAERATGPSP